MTAAVQEQGGAGTGTAGPAASSEQPSQETVPVPPQPAQADQLGQPPQTVQGEEPAVNTAPAGQEQGGGASTTGNSVMPGGSAGTDSRAGSGGGATAESGAVTAKAAEENALAHAGLTAEQVTYIQSKADYEDGRPVYDVEFYTQDGKEYDYEIDGATGEVIGFDYEAEGYGPPAAAGGSGLTAEEAKALALKKGWGVEVLAHPGGVYEEADVTELTHGDDVKFLTSEFRQTESEMFSKLLKMGTIA